MTRTQPPVDLPLVDIHCHLLPGIDDGAKSWEESLEMAGMAVADGIGTVIVTPHQLGVFAHNAGPLIRHRTNQLQQQLNAHRIPLRVLPGADVRVEPEMMAGLRSGDVLTLGDHRRHVLLELPHELYFSLDGVLRELEVAGMTGVLSHPERNQGLLKQPRIVGQLVDAGCLMQITAGSLMGTFGPASQQMSERMLEDGLVHFVATDAHGARSRRPLLRPAWQTVAAIAGADEADALCGHHPAAVAAGAVVDTGRRAGARKRFSSWLPWKRKAA